MILDDTVKALLNERLSKLEEYFKVDVIFYFGEISISLTRIFRDFIEKLDSSPKSQSPSAESQDAPVKKNL